MTPSSSGTTPCRSTTKSCARPCMKSTHGRTGASASQRITPPNCRGAEPAGSGVMISDIDRPAVPAKTGRPRSIVWFETLMYLNLIGGFVFGSLHGSGSAIEKYGAAFYVVVLGIVVGLWTLA